jgi:hypothetical protein
VGERGPPSGEPKASLADSVAPAAADPSWSLSMRCSTGRVLSNTSALLLLLLGPASGCVPSPSSVVRDRWWWCVCPLPFRERLRLEPALALCWCCWNAWRARGGSSDPRRRCAGRVCSIELERDEPWPLPLPLRGVRGVPLRRAEVYETASAKGVP